MGDVQSLLHNAHKCPVLSKIAGLPSSQHLVDRACFCDIDLVGNVTLEP
jgi:hypothetical protein